MSRLVLKYVYLVLGTGVAMLMDRASPRERRQLLQRGAPRSPTEAATFRANEWVRRPLRTVGLLVGYQLLFTGVAICTTFPDQVVAVLGRDVGGAGAIVGALVRPAVPAGLVPLLPAIGVVLGVAFPLIVHQSLVTAGDIRRYQVA